MAAGWHPAEIAWERVELAAAEAWVAGDHAAAARLWRRGWAIARRRFAADDPRLATALANAGMADMVRGRAGRGAHRLAEARRLWAGVPGWIARAGLRPLARSSLFHLRMEARHRAAFAENARRPLLALADDAAGRLSRVAAGDAPRPCPDRWRRERPPVHDDRRRLVAAALLLAA
jgi:hypothetical protein